MKAVTRATALCKPQPQAEPFYITPPFHSFKRCINGLVCPLKRLEKIIVSTYTISKPISDESHTEIPKKLSKMHTTLKICSFCFPVRSEILVPASSSRCELDEVYRSHICQKTGTRTISGDLSRQV